MKKIHRSAALLAVLSLFSCSDGDYSGVAPRADVHPVRVGVVHSGGKLTTRVDAAPIASGTPFAPRPGHLFFVTSAGVIEHHVGIDTNAGSSRISSIDLFDGEAVVAGVSTTAHRCYIVSGDSEAAIDGTDGTGGGAITGNLEGQSIDDVLDLAATVSNMNTPLGDVGTIPLVGSGTVSVDSGKTALGEITYGASVTVRLNSLISRIQIREIAATDYEYLDESAARQTIGIEGFNVDGIFVNNFFQRMTIGSTYPSAITDFGSVATNYSAAGTAPYSSSGIGYMLSDDALDLASVAGSATPTNGSWSYNVFPTPKNDWSSVPHIIIRLTGVRYTDSATRTSLQRPGDAYITVAGMTHAAGTPVTSLDANTTYTFDKITFDYGDLTAVPEMDGGGGADRRARSGPRVTIEKHITERP